MKVSYRQDLAHSCIVMETDGTEEVDEFAVKMILKNDIDGLLKPEMQEMNGKTRLIYDIGTKYSMLSLFEMKKMTSKDMSYFMESLQKSVCSMEDYLLDTNLLILDPEYIYAEKDADRFYFCVSLNTDSFHKQMAALAEMLITVIDYDDSELVRTAYSINMAMNENNFSIDSVFSALEEDSVAGQVLCEETYEEYSPENECFSEIMPETDRDMRQAEEEKKVLRRSGNAPQKKRSMLVKLKDYIEDMF